MVLIIYSHSLKTKSRRHIDNIVVTGGTVSCQNNNLRCHPWGQCCQFDDLLFSVLSEQCIFGYSTYSIMHIKKNAYPWWRNQMETFPRNWPFVRGIHRSPVNSPHKGQWGGALMFSLIYVSIKDWVNNHEAGDLRRYRAHYDVMVMLCIFQGYSIGTGAFVWSSQCHCSNPEEYGENCMTRTSIKGKIVWLGPQ